MASRKQTVKKAKKAGAKKTAGASSKKAGASSKRAGASSKRAGASAAARKAAAARPAAKRTAGASSKKAGASSKKAGAKRPATRKQAAAPHEHGSPLEVVEAVLKAAGWEPERHDEEGGWTAFVTWAQEGVIRAVVARVSEELERFALYLLFQPNVPEDRRAEVAELLTRANDGLADGNFEMSYDSGEVRLKIAVDFSGMHLEPRFVRNAILDAVEVNEVYEAALVAVMEGKMSAKEAVDKAESVLH